MDELRKKRFLWGLVLVWAPWIPTLIGLAGAFNWISTRKATGIGVVLGSLTELFVICGIGAIVIGQVTAIVFLFRAFSSAHWIRSLFSVLFVCLSGLMLLLVGVFLWLSWSQTHHSF